jgi:hypothetical protein
MKSKYGSIEINVGKKPEKNKNLINKETSQRDKDFIERLRKKYTKNT